MLRSPECESPGAGTPGLEFESKIQHPDNARILHEQQLVLRDGLWELCSIFVACGVAAMATASGGSVQAIEVDLRSARLALIEAIETFKDLRALLAGETTP